MSLAEEKVMSERVQAGGASGHLAAAQAPGLLEQLLFPLLSFSSLAGGTSTSRPTDL